MDAAFGMALLLTTLAGLSTGIGSLIGIAFRPGPRFMATSLGFAAGIMILVSFAELLPAGLEELGFLPAYAAFFGGMLLMFLLDVSVPHLYLAEAPQEGRRAALWRTSVLLMLGIGIHNFPEGMATFAATLKETDLGIAMAVAIAVHNIPEGIAVSAPVFAATGSRKRAFLFSLLSGVAEPVGALIAGLVLLPFLTPAALAAMLAVVAGLMVFISLDELVPAANAYGHEHTTILAAMGGMAIMAASLWLLG
ncbi:MAG: zinc transporter ZupT [Candidatus Eisenbacteria bacterium]|nr:zinc transporter ZupT [Candidatus Eisenbacteria bacterium]